MWLLANPVERAAVRYFMWSTFMLFASRHAFIIACFALFQMGTQWSRHCKDTIGDQAQL